MQSTATRTSCIDAALEYLRRGWAPLPLCPPDHRGMTQRHCERCNSPGKAPWPKWKDFQERLPTESEIRDWFRRCPASNVGAALGPVSGIIRIDVDGDAGREFLRAKSGGELPRTPLFSSGGGGIGFLFAIPPGVELRTTKKSEPLKAHSEIRFQAKGAQTAMPPSLHVSGRRYEWAAGFSPDEIELAPMPAWLVEEMRVKPKATRSPGNNGYDHDPEHNREVALAALNALSQARCDDHELWLQVGMALHAVDASAGMLGEWDRWSRGSGKYRDGECATRWESFNGSGGISIGSLVKWARDDSPGWQPPRRNREVQIIAGSAGRYPRGDEDRRVAIANVERIKKLDDAGNEAETVVPVPMPGIIRQIADATGGWPRRVGDALFVPQGAGIAWLNSADALMGWIGTATGVPARFARGDRVHTAAHVFHELRRLATSYVAVEVLPHEPPMKGHYYAYQFPTPGDGSALRGLVDRYNPETTIDRDLITAMFVTPFWGGDCGLRPAFLVTSDAGRGAGKTTLVSHVAYLTGGAIELSANEDAAVMKQRLLSPEGIIRRVANLDNVKTLRFSWAELEALITAPVISGKRLYHGEASRPNNLTWSITLNGTSLAKDLAQRCVIIKIGKPNRGATWAEETRQYIDQHRQAIIADCIGFLRGERLELDRYSRWASWERDVLCRLSEPGEAQAVILERQAVADVEDEEAELIQDYFADRLRGLCYDADRDRVFIPSGIAAEWYCNATRDKLTTTAVSRRLNQAITEGTVRLLTQSKRNDWGRGFVWWPPGSPADASTHTDVEDRQARKDSYR